MRTKHSFLNMAVGVGGQLLGTLLSFVARLVFIRYLSAEYLGVGGLFSNILGMLSLAELGIGSAMIFSLYKPVAEKRNEEISCLMNLYRILYRFVALAVLLLGLLLLPFLGYFIKGDANIEHLHLIYLMYLANTVSSYLLCYKHSLFIASQRAYIKIMYEQVMHIIQILTQIVVLVLTRNFILYLAVEMVNHLLLNLMVKCRADKEYPFLSEYKGLPEREKCIGIAKNVGAMSIHRLGGVLVNGTDSLLISVFAGLVSTGIYSNYKLILVNIEYLMDKIYGAFAGSIGNLGATESGDKIYKIYRTLDFFMAWVFGYIAVMLVVMFNPFIELFFGKKYLFPMLTVLLLVSAFYFKGIRQMTIQFKDGMGLFWHDRYKPVAEVIINLVVSVVLASRIGISGIFAGTIVSYFTTAFWVEPYVLMRYGMKQDWKKKLGVYFAHFAARVVCVCGIGYVCMLACSRIPGTNLAWLVLKGVTGTLIYGLLMLMLIGRRWELRFLIKKGKEFLKIRKNKDISEDR